MDGCGVKVAALGSAGSSIQVRKMLKAEGFKGPTHQLAIQVRRP